MQIVSVLTQNQIDQKIKLNYNKPKPLKMLEHELKIKASPEYQNLLSAFERADNLTVEEGKRWYNIANSIAQEMANQYGTSVVTTASVIAALSPAVKWDRNLIDAEALIKAYYHRGYIGAKSVTVSTYGTQKTKAIEILCNRFKLSPNSGLKTWHFANNIVDPLDYNYVTIDRHAYRIATNLNDAGAVKITPKQYNYIAGVYKYVAKDVGFTPCQLQATLWVQHRRENGKE